MRGALLAQFGLAHFELENKVQSGSGVGLYLFEKGRFPSKIES